MGGIRTCQATSESVFIRGLFLAAFPATAMVRCLSRWVVAGGFLLCLTPHGVSSAQDAPRRSEIRGVVIRGADRIPVPDAQLSIQGTDLAVVTDKNGKFKFPKVAAGEYIVRAEVGGFPPATSVIQVEDGDRLEMEFQVGSSGAQPLPDIEVVGEDVRVSPIVEFSRRATEGRGRYILRAEIEQRRPASLMALMRSVPGARIICPRTEHRCELRLRRANCGPAYFLDGIPSDPSILYLTVPSDVEGIEIYSGPSETPIELESVRAGCGVIAIWTRVGQRPSERRPDPPLL